MEDNPPRLSPILSSNEHDALVTQLKLATVGLEFGMGGSTLMAARLKVPFYHSVESDAGWVQRCSSHPAIHALIENDRFNLCHVDIGPVGAGGFPTDKSHASKWVNYHADVWDHMSNLPDLVFIDGRFRLACALQAAARCAPGTSVLIHDYSDRPYYHEIEHFLEKGARVDTLQFFKVVRLPLTSTFMDCLSRAFLDPR